MTNINRIHLILGIYWLVTFLASLWINGLIDLLGFENFSSFLAFQKIWFGLGLLLFLVGWYVSFTDSKKLDNKVKKLESENNEVKAKLYDSEHPSTMPVETEKPHKAEEDGPEQ